MATVIGQLRGPDAKGASAHFSDHALRRMVVKFIYGSPSDLSDTELASGAEAVAQRIAEAEAANISPADVVRALLRPVFDVDSHCRCRACGARCLVCQSFAASVEAPG